MTHPDAKRCLSSIFKPNTGWRRWPRRQAWVPSAPSGHQSFGPASGQQKALHSCRLGFRTHHPILFTQTGFPHSVWPVPMPDSYFEHHPKTWWEERHREVGTSSRARSKAMLLKTGWARKHLGILCKWGFDSVGLGDSCQESISDPLPGPRTTL